MRASQSSAIPHLTAALTAKRATQAARPYVLQTCFTQFTAGYVASHRGFAYKRLSKPPPPARYTSRKPSGDEGSDAGDAANSVLTAGRHGRKIGPYIWACCIAGFAVAAYGSYSYSTYSKALKVAEYIDLPQNADVSDRWKDRSRNFDHEVEASEKVMFLKAKRRRLVNNASGNVLEVSCGTGRNMDLYDLRPYDPRETEATGRSRRTLITAVTFNDQSEVMVERAESKFKDMEAKRPVSQRFNGAVSFIVGDAGIKGVIQRPVGGYDTIVQTMGVCSMADAPLFLRRLGELARQPGEDSKWLPPEADDGKGGKILLLEHGRGYYSWINRILDNGAKMHANHYGCWWNKDVQTAVEQSGLAIEKVRRYNFGTTYEYVLRPSGPGKSTESTGTTSTTS